MSESVKLSIQDKEYELDVIKGSEGEKGIDISRLRAETGYITLDVGFANSGSCISDISFIDGEEGILRHRGYPIEELCENLSFVQIAWLLIFGELPNEKQHKQFSTLLTENARLHTSYRKHFDAFPESAPPMAILSSMLNVLSCHHPELLEISEGEDFLLAAAKIISKVRTIAAYSFRRSQGLVFMPPHPDFSYASNFLHMMFSEPYRSYEAHPDVEKALNLFLILHADHEQNCSTSTVRMVGSSRANMFSSVSAGVSALWGPLHGGANVGVIQMLQDIHETGKSPEYFIELAKDKSSSFKLFGFGHRVYKNFDPRAKILKVYVDKVLKLLKVDDPLLDIALRLEELALEDEYFAQRKLFPNVDFYSGILLRAIGMPLNMFTVMFSIGRMPGWIANWKELHDQNLRISRPRQIYTGNVKRSLK